MGGNGSSRHVSFDPAYDEEQGVTFVKGIRLSQRVIDRMKESPPVVHPQASPKSSTQSTAPVAPPAERLVPGEHHVPIIPRPPSYASTLVPPPVLEPITPFVPLVTGTEETSAPPSNHLKSPESLPNPPPTGDELVVILVPDPQPAVPPAEPINAPSTVSSEPITASPRIEPLTPPPSITSSTEPFAIPPSPTTDPLTEPVTPIASSVEAVTPIGSPVEAVTPIGSPVEPVTPIGSSVEPVRHIESSFEPVTPIGSSVEEPVTPQLEVFPLQTHVVNEEKLKRQLREDLQKLLNEEMKMAERNMRQQLEEEKAKAKAQAQAAARLQIQDEVRKLLEEEKASYQQTLADAIRMEQLKVQDEHLITQYYAQKLEEKEKDLENQDALFREQIAKMQEKMAQFTKVTAENYKKGLEDAHNRFRRCQIKPVCSDLQSQILKCYAENKGQTMSCSSIASLYIQCVDRARQDKKLSTGG
uniref:Coiled-coil-helix-coiled-coil-helix domain containing 3b n=1 Tax=Cyprinus carpio TaxID=7962 RepID=A0A8C1SIU0_CYPCA